MKLPKQKVNKLFYNKWPYKVSCYIKGAHLVRLQGIDRLRIMAADVGSIFADEQWGWGARRAVLTLDKDDILAFTEAVTPFMNMIEEVQIRVEGARFNLFCKDINIKDDMGKALLPWLLSVQGPESQEELEFLLAENHKVICETLPHGKFKFKVLMKDWIKTPEIKQHINDYLKKLDPESVKISPQTVKWLDGKLNYKQDPFFYLVDDKALLFLRLMTTDIKRVYEYVERNSINTALQ